MTTDNQTKDPNNYVDLVKKAITENNFEYYDYSEFINVNEIINGSVGNIFQANWRETGILMIKSSYNAYNVEEIVNEIKIRREVDFHPNILKFYGISLETGLVNNQMNKYSLVLEYADGGSLYSYLKNNFNKLEWCDKHRLALQLASAIECIHNKGIIHCDLHAYNVFVHQDNIKLSDFGLSKRISEASNYPKGAFGLLPYVDPKCLNYICNIKDGDQTYEINAKSDIYSIGVLFWQLSSGNRPFCTENDEDVQYDEGLAIAIENGKREDIIKGTPVEYSNLYTACWSGDPNKRPTIQQIISSLKSIISSQENNEEILQTEIEKLPEPISFSINEDIITGQHHDSDTEENEGNEIPLYILKQTEKLFKEPFNLTNTSINIIIDKLIMLLIRVHDEKGYDFTEASQFISQCISLLNQPQNNILDWLLRNQTTSQYIFFLGFLYYNGIIVEVNSNEAFKLFSKASEAIYQIAQIYLSICYHTGIGTEINSALAITYLYNAIENNSIFGQVILGNLYEVGVGVDRDLSQAFYWYEEAANNGNLSGLYYLAICYQYENGVEKDENKAFALYMKAANQENLNAQYELGVCYYYGIGTNINKVKAFDLFKIVAKERYHGDAQNFLGVFYEKGEVIKKDLVKAFYWYQKAAENGNEIAQYNLGLCYEKGNGTEKDEVKAFGWYRKSAEQEYSNAQNSLGICYEKGTCIEKHLEKAFYWYQKAAENGNKVAQYNLGRCYQYEMSVEKDEVKTFEWYKRSAEQGYSNAQNGLGVCYENGTGTEKDIEKAFYWYQKAAENDNKVAKYNLGRCYYDGKGVEKNEIKGFEWYKKSAEQGCSIAQFSLGVCYENGIGIEKDEVKAFEWYLRSAEQENSNAQTNLGELYRLGEGIEKDLEKALYWYKKASENGNKVASYNLGECFEFGIGVNKDDNKAFEWYEKSAKDGIINGKFQLGYCYVNGIGIEINKEKGFELYNEAAGEKNDNYMQINIGLKYEDEKTANYLNEINHWYKKAAENDNKVALYKLGEFYELGKGVYGNKFRAFEFYKKSAEQGFINAQYKVGYYYDHGIEVDVNKEKAFNVYEIAAKEGNFDAQKSLALLYEQGEGTEKSIEKAIYWYKKAVENGCQEAKECLNNLLSNNGN